MNLETKIQKALLNKKLGISGFVIPSLKDDIIVICQDFTIEFANWLLENAYMNGTTSYKTCTKESQGKNITAEELLIQFKKEKLCIK